MCVCVSCVVAMCLFTDDIDECAHGRDRCDQLCFNTRGSYTCACHPAYTLQTNGYVCQKDGQYIP